MGASEAAGSRAVTEEEARTLRSLTDWELRARVRTLQKMFLSDRAEAARLAQAVAYREEVLAMTQTKEGMSQRVKAMTTALLYARFHLEKCIANKNYHGRAYGLAVSELRARRESPYRSDLEANKRTAESA
jgi:hypothetical protein